MQILICARSNYQWQVKQQIAGLSFEQTKGVRALQWIQSKKNQLFYLDGKGKFSFVEFNFNQATSLMSFNHQAEENLAYVCVVDNFNLNLTPLARQLMPPPMFLK